MRQNGCELRGFAFGYKAAAWSYLSVIIIPNTSGTPCNRGILGSEGPMTSYDISPNGAFGPAFRTERQDNALSLERSGGIACSGMGLVSATCRRCGSEPLRGQRRGHDSPDPGCAYLRCLQ